MFFFLKYIDLSMSNVNVTLTEEGAVDDGDSFREFLQLPMQNLPKY